MEAKKIATRDGFGEAIVELGRENGNVLVVDIDIGKSCKTAAFRKELPGQYINVGIAEQNGAGVAAGLATCGKIPFVVTYAAFGSMRICEMIRQEICYPNLNVKIACSHGGLTPANDGASHQCIEDMGILRTLPNMTIVMPADYNAAKALVKEAAAYYGPMYLRFTRDAVPQIYGEDAKFEIGKANMLRDGRDVAIIANGDTVCIALDAAKALEAKGISARVLDMHTIKPLDIDAVNACIEDTGRIITVEDHNILAAFIAGVSSSKYVFLLLVNLLLLVVGCFMDTQVSIVIIAPILLPVANALGINTIHFGIVMICNLAIGLITPPLGMNLNVASGIGHVPLTYLIKRHLLGYLIADIAALLVITYVPALSLILPGMNR